MDNSPAVAAPIDHKPHRNSPERRQMLAMRRVEQEARTGGVWQFGRARGDTTIRLRKNSAGPTRMIGVPASINHRTGKPHNNDTTSRCNRIVARFVSQQSVTK